MTSSVSGFLAPEERAALEQNRTSAVDGSPVDLTAAILEVLNRGPMTLTNLVAEVHASPRAVVSTVDSLMPIRLLKISNSGDDEIVELTEAGHRFVNE